MMPWEEEKNPRTSSVTFFFLSKSIFIYQNKIYFPHKKINQVKRKKYYINNVAYERK